MNCKFCGQDVEKPCNNTVEMAKRSQSGVGHCSVAARKYGGPQDGLPAVDDEKGWYG